MHQDEEESVSSVPPRAGLPDYLLIEPAALLAVLQLNANLATITPVEDNFQGPGNRLQNYLNCASPPPR